MPLGNDYYKIRKANTEDTLFEESYKTENLIQASLSVM